MLTPVQPPRTSWPNPGAPRFNPPLTLTAARVAGIIVFAEAKKVTKNEQRVQRERERVRGREGGKGEKGGDEWKSIAGSK